MLVYQVELKNLSPHKEKKREAVGFRNHFVTTARDKSDRI
jgi:hypothetical protein